MGALSDVKFEKKAVGNMDTKIIELKVNYRLQECKTEKVMEKVSIIHGCILLKESTLNF